MWYKTYEQHRLTGLFYHILVVIKLLIRSIAVSLMHESWMGSLWIFGFRSCFTKAKKSIQHPLGAEIVFRCLPVVHDFHNLDMRCTQLTVTWYNPPHDYNCLLKAYRHTHILTHHPCTISMVCQICLSVFSDKLFPCTSNGQSYGLSYHFMKLLVRVDVRILATLPTHIPTPNTIPLIIVEQGPC